MIRDMAVIIPAYNAGAHLARALASIDGQDHVKEIVVACHDDTSRAVAHAHTPADPALTYTVIDNPSGTTPDALNAALAASSAPYVARLDAHATFTAGYLTTARTILANPAIANVGGIQQPHATAGFQRAVAAALQSVAGSGAATYRTGSKAADTDTVYLGVFRRTALEEVNGFNPQCLRNQDAELNIRLRQAGYRVRFDPRLVATYTPRATIRALARQYHDYGRWRRYTHKSTGAPYGLRQLLLPLLVGILVAAVIAAVVTGQILFFTPVVGYLLLMKVAAMLAANTHPDTRLWDTGAIVVALLVMHLAWGSGFMRGAPTKAVS
ncbi:MAG: glycosyltransferase [Nitriliruptoraceae bacterium]